MSRELPLSPAEPLARTAGPLLDDSQAERALLLSPARGGRPRTPPPSRRRFARAGGGPSIRTRRGRPLTPGRRRRRGVRPRSREPLPPLKPPVPAVPAALGCDSSALSWSAQGPLDFGLTRVGAGRAGMRSRTFFGFYDFLSRVVTRRCVRVEAPRARSRFRKAPRVLNRRGRVQKFTKTLLHA